MLLAFAIVTITFREMPFGVSAASDADQACADPDPDVERERVLFPPMGNLLSIVG
jgi:hypothetical protein